VSFGLVIVRATCSGRSGSTGTSALVGNHLEPSGLKPKADGTKINTLWGELAWQPGGQEAYEIVAESDRTSTNPGDSLRELLAKYAPAVILIDEWVAYARQLRIRRLGVRIPSGAPHRRVSPRLARSPRCRTASTFLSTVVLRNQPRAQ
jgi:Protein of unknown function (DUF499)